MMTLTNIFSEEKKNTLDLRDIQTLIIVFMQGNIKSTKRSTLTSFKIKNIKCKITKELNEVMVKQMDLISIIKKYWIAYTEGSYHLTTHEED